MFYRNLSTQYLSLNAFQYLCSAYILHRISFGAHNNCVDLRGNPFPVFLVEAGCSGGPANRML